LSGAGDKIDDPSIAWPATRELVDVGEIEITSVVADSEVAERALIFIPAALPPGIEPADPMILVRSAAYSVSYGHRHQ
jgi:catalase